MAYAASRMRGTGIAIALLALAIGGAGGWLWMQGSILLLDRRARVADVVILSNAGMRMLPRYPGRIFFGMIERDAQLRLLCRNGRVIELGRLSTGSSVWRLLSPPEGC